MTNPTRPSDPSALRPFRTIPPEVCQELMHWLAGANSEELFDFARELTEIVHELNRVRRIESCIQAAEEDRRSVLNRLLARLDREVAP